MNIKERLAKVRFFNFNVAPNFPSLNESLADIPTAVRLVYDLSALGL